MVQSPETVNITTTLIGGAIVSSGSGLALLAPHSPSGDEVNANVVKKVKLQRSADEFFGAGSDLANGFQAAKRSGISEVLMVGVEALSGSPFSETSGDSDIVQDSTDTGAMAIANLPLTEVSSVTNDGTPLTIEYTHADPTALSPGTDTIIINPFTGAWKVDTPTSGAGAGIIITYDAHDWDAAFEVLDLNNYEYAVPAGTAFNAQYWGIYQKFLSHAVDEDKMLAFALDSGVAPSDVKDMVEDSLTQSGRAFLLAAYYTGDLTSAIAGQLASSRTRSTRKLQDAPAGVSYTGTYTFSDYGSEESPVDGTFHEMGANAVYQSATGAYEVTNDRAVTALDDDERFHSTARMARDARHRIKSALLGLRRASDTAIPLSDAGIATVKATIERECFGLLSDEIIDRYVIDAPSISDISTSDRKKRILDLFEVNVRLTGQVHLLDIDLNVEI